MKQLGCGGKEGVLGEARGAGGIPGWTRAHVRELAVGKDVSGGLQVTKKGEAVLGGCPGGGGALGCFEAL